MVRPFLPLSLSLSLSLFFCSRAENRIGGVLVKKWEKKKVERWKALVPPEEPDRDRQTHIHEIVGLRGSRVFTRH